MRKLIKITITLIVILVLAAIIIPFLIPLDSYKQEIISQVKEKTGRDLVIDGSIKASIFPVLGVELNKVSLSSGAGYTAKNLLEVEKLNLKVGLKELIQKKLQVQQFVLAKPIINLEVSANGKPNWEFGTAAAPEKTKEKTEDSSRGGASMLAGLMLGDVKITDGEINYNDIKSKKILSLKSLNLKASLPDISEPFNADGDAVWNNEKVTIKASVANPNQIMEGKNSDFALDIKSTPVTLNYAGEASENTAKGKLALAVPSIPNLAKWTGSAFEWKGSTPLTLAVNGNLTASAKNIALDNSEITLDAIKLAGKLKVGLEEKTPSIDATFASESLDLNPYLKNAPEKTSWLVSPAFAAEWSNDKIDLSALKSVNANMNLAFGSILYEKIKLGKTLINAQLNNGLLKFAVPSSALYGGDAKITATLNSDGAFTKQVNLTNINAEGLLRDATGHDRFSGTLNSSVNLNGKLTTMQGVMKSLNGSGNFKVDDGSIKGIDLEAMMRNVPAAFNNVNSAQQVTKFSDLSGTFAINQGILSNKDLSMKTNMLNVAGQGTVDLPQKTINYRINPMIGGKAGKQGLEVPVLIQGPFDNLRYIPDLASMLKTNLQNPEAMENTIRSVKDQFKDMKGGGKDAVKDVQDLLKGFGQ